MLRLLLACLLCVTGALAQSTLATITGVVTDQEGAVVPKVAIEAVHTQTGYRFSSTSNEVGLYTVPQLPHGEYTMTAKVTGFQEATVRDIILNPRDIRRIDIKLSIATVQQAVEVTAGATLIETETARLADTKSGALMNALPYGGRGAFMMFQVIPNVSRLGSAYVMRFAGSRTNQSDYSMDGVSFMVASGSNPNAPLTDYTETMEETRVDVANNTAEHSTIGQVSMISKSGTNELHGSGFNFYISPVLRAREYFALARSAGVSNKPGFTLGGPVYLPKIYDGRNRTFFFSSMELGLWSATTPTLAATVPLASWRAGDFSNLSAAIVDPFNSSTPFPGNRIPTSRLNPVSQKIQERFYPLPTEGDPNVLTTNNFRKMENLRGTREWYFTERVDHRISDKVQLTGRMVHHGYNSYRITSQLGGRANTTIKWKTRFYSFSYTHSISPTKVNEFRVGYSFNNNPRYPVESGLKLVQDLGLAGLVPDLPDYPGVFYVGWSGLGLTGISDGLQYRDSKGGRNFYFQDHLSWFTGRHAFKVGAQFNHSSVNDRFLSTNIYGNVTFTNRFTNQPYADFLLGLPSTTRRAEETPFDEAKRDSTALFIQDEFRVNNQLTLNLGVRWEYEPGWYGPRMAMFEPNLSKIVVPDDSMKLVSPRVPKSYVEVISASQAGLPKSTLIRGDRNNFAPRIGVAWRPFGPDTVLRAGYGLFYDLVPRSLLASGAPFVISEPEYTNPKDAPTVIFPRVWPEAGSGSVGSISIPGATNPNLVTPYSMQYNFTVEHQRWNTGFRASYIGTNTRQGEYSYNMNQPIADGRTFYQKRNERAFPQYPNISYYTNGAGHQYHAMTLQLTRRTRGGMYFSTYYTLARDIGDLDRGESPEDSWNRARERGVWADIPTHRWNATGSYELPFGKGKHFLTGAGRALNLLVGGWEVNGVYSIQTGEFLTPTWSGPDTTGTVYTTSTTPGTITRRADHLRDANLPSDQRTRYRWFDTTAFAAPQPGAFGTSARGVIKGPGLNLFSATLVKNFHLTERFRLRGELAATNAFNHPNWSNPGVVGSSANSFGLISAAAGNSGGALEGSSARAMMVRMRVEF